VSVVVSHPTGIRNLRALLRLLVREQWLDSFWTTVALPSPVLTSPFLPTNMRSALSRRCFSEAPWRDTRLSPSRELVRLASRGFGWSRLCGEETSWASIDSVYRGVDARVAAYLHARSARHVRVVYAYEDGAAETFKAALDRGVHRVYHLPIMHWRVAHRLFEEERERWPEWAGSLQGLRDSGHKLERKDQIGRASCRERV